MNDKTLVEAVAVRFDFDGYGYQYMDSGSGSDWLTRKADAEPLFSAETIGALQSDLTRQMDIATEYVNKCEALKSRIEVLEAALRFYARENSWKSCGIYMSGRSQPSAAEVDRGNKARKALESQP